jgi:hypothetical protein
MCEGARNTSENSIFLYGLHLSNLVTVISDFHRHRHLPNNGEAFEQKYVLHKREPPWTQNVYLERTLDAVTKWILLCRNNRPRHAIWTFASANTRRAVLQGSGAVRLIHRSPMLLTDPCLIACTSRSVRLESFQGKAVPAPQRHGEKACLLAFRRKTSDTERPATCFASYTT